MSFIYPGWVKGGEVAEKFFKEIKEGGENEDFNNMNSINNWKIDLSFDRGHAVIAQQSVDGEYIQLVSTAATVGVIGVATAAVIFTGGISLAAIPTALSFGGLVAVGSGSVVYVLTSPEGYDYVSPSVVEFNPEELNKLECNDFEIAP